MRADERQAVWACRSKTGPTADDLQRVQAGQVVAGAAQHACQYRYLNSAVSRVKLAGRADQQLPGGARLHIEGDRGAAALVRAFDIAQFHQLVAHHAGGAGANGQVPFFGLQWQFGAERGGAQTCGQHDVRRAACAAVRQTHAAIFYRADLCLQYVDAACAFYNVCIVPALRTQPLRHALAQQPARRIGGIHNAIAGHLQRPG